MIDIKEFFIFTMIFMIWLVITTFLFKLANDNKALSDVCERQGYTWLSGEGKCIEVRTIHIESSFREKQ